MIENIGDVLRPVRVRGLITPRLVLILRFVIVSTLSALCPSTRASLIAR